MPILMSVVLVFMLCVAIAYHHNFQAGDYYVFLCFIGIGLGFGPLLAWRFQIRVDEEYLWYRAFFKFQRIRLSDIDRIDQNPRGVRPPDAYTPWVNYIAWFVHPKPGSEANGFIIKMNFLSKKGLCDFVLRMRPYFPSDYKSFLPPDRRKQAAKYIEENYKE